MYALGVHLSSEPRVGEWLSKNWAQFIFPMACEKWRCFVPVKARGFVAWHQCSSTRTQPPSNQWSAVGWLALPTPFWAEQAGARDTLKLAFRFRQSVCGASQSSPQRWWYEILQHGRRLSRFVSLRCRRRRRLHVAIPADNLNVSYEVYLMSWIRDCKGICPGTNWNVV